ncbi:hypothetical protein [Aeromonas media]|uniref:hypothetical protein n=1 Tax=Aeromonas media TaxID=651 RepID=UPI003D1A174A
MEYDHHLEEDFKEYRLALIAAAANKIRNKRESTWRPHKEPLSIPLESPPKTLLETIPSIPTAKATEVIRGPYRPISKQSDYKEQLLRTVRDFEISDRRKRRLRSYKATIRGAIIKFPFYCGDCKQRYYLLNESLDKTLIYLLVLHHGTTSRGSSFRTYHNRNGKQYVANLQALEWLVEELNKD